MEMKENWWNFVMENIIVEMNFFFCSFWYDGSGMGVVIKWCEFSNLKPHAENIVQNIVTKNELKNL